MGIKGHHPQSDRVCHLHFKDTDFFPGGVRLKRNIVVPSQNIPDRFKVGPMIPMEVECSNEEHNYSIASNSNPMIVQLRQEISELRAEKLIHLAEIKVLSRKNADLSRKVGYYKTKYESMLSGNFCKKTINAVVSKKLSQKNYTKGQIGMMLSDKKRLQSRQWCRQDYKFAAKVCQLSPKALDLVRKLGLVHLPASNTIQKRYSWIHSIPGYLKPIVCYYKLSKIF